MKHADNVTGYLHATYAASLAEFGMPRLLPRSRGWVLERPIGVQGRRDATGCYPLFACSDWSQLQIDFDELAAHLVCVSLVTDPFGDFLREDLQKYFKDKFLPFKEHFVVDLRRAPADFVSKHHRYYSRRALRGVEIERCDYPALFLEDWLELYNYIIKRNNLTGIKAFSPRSFEIQLRVPGAVMLRAIHNGTTVSAHLWYVQRNVAYSHLAASSPHGYELMAPYALHWYALEAFAGEVEWINLGATAGIAPQAKDGLARFKSGWSTGTRTAYLCGRIFDQAGYAEAVAARRMSESDYFPAYRKNELI